MTAPAHTAHGAALRAQADALAAQVTALRALADAIDAGLVLAAPTPAPAAAPWIDKRELGRALAVSVATVDRLDREGQPHVYIGDVKRYDLAAVLAWHRERSPRPEAPASSPRPALPPAPASSGVRVLTRRKGSSR